MQLYFIRHAESTNNRLYAQTGSDQGRSEDPELTDLGCQQAQALARYLADPANFPPSEITRRLPSQGEAPPDPGGLTHLYTSLMVRAVATASLIAEATGLTPEGWLDLHEEGGIFREQEPPCPGDPPLRIGLPGKTRRYFEVHYPRLKLPPQVGEDGWWNRPFEERAERPQRAARLLSELLRRHAAPRPDGGEDRIALVSHGGFYNLFMRQVLSLPATRPDGTENAIWFALYNTAITRLDYRDGQWVVVYQNRVAHLPPAWIT